MKSPLCYMGGKSRLVKKIVPMIPEHKCYVEPFCGAAWIFFGKDPSEAEVLNDADGELVNFWRVIQHHLQPFLDYYKYAIISRKLFDLENIKRPETLTDIQRAVRYYYLQRLAFGGKTHDRTFGTTTSGGPRLNLATIEESLLEVHWRLERVVVENLDSCDCIRRYDRPETFFYIDPPYFKTAGYGRKWDQEDFVRLNFALLKIAGKFIMSINDAPEIRELFKKFRISKVSTAYSITNGRTANNGRKKERSELIIRNFK